MRYRKLWYIISMIFLLGILFLFLFSLETNASIEPYIQIAKEYNSEFAGYRGIEKMTTPQATQRVKWLKHYSEQFECDIHPHRLWKDAFFIVLHETGFVNYESLDEGRSLGWISMRKTTIDMLNEIYEFKEVPYYRVINSPKLQAKYIISYLAWLNNIGDRYLSIVRYNRGLGYSDFTGNEDYFQKVISLIKKYEGGQNESLQY